MDSILPNKKPYIPKIGKVSTTTPLSSFSLASLTLFLRCGGGDGGSKYDGGIHNDNGGGGRSISGLVMVFVEVVAVVVKVVVVGLQ